MHYQRFRKYGSATAGRQPNGMSEREAFEYYMPGPPPDSGCWDWAGTVRESGYGSVWVGGVPVPAHRVSYRIFNGPFDESLDILHSCDRPVCVQPKHLDDGTHARNMYDAAVRNRMKVKLSNEQVAEIRTRVSQGDSQRAIAAQYGVDPSTVSLVASGKRRKHVQPVVEAS